MKLRPAQDDTERPSALTGAQLARSWDSFETVDTTAIVGIVGAGTTALTAIAGYVFNQRRARGERERAADRLDAFLGQASGS